MKPEFHAFALEDVTEDEWKSIRETAYEMMSDQMHGGNSNRCFCSAFVKHLIDTDSQLIFEYPDDKSELH